MQVRKTVFDRYELSEPLDVSHFPGAVEAGLEAFHAVDKVTQQRVVVKLFPIPNDPELALFASALWDREVRITHFATSGPKGRALLRLLDARRDKGSAKLVLVSEAGGTRLADILAEEPRPSILQKANRHTLWDAFGTLARALEALHSAGLLHRSMSPDVIYLEEDESKPTLRLGDFSWSVYLHGLSRMVSEPSAEFAFAGAGSWSKYVAPEVLNGLSAVGESFRSDIFSLGLVIVECLIGPLVPLGGERGNWIDDIRAIVRGDGDLNQKEKTLLLRMLDPVPTGRPASAGEIADTIQTIVTGLDRTLPAFSTSAMTVVFDTRPESPMWKALGKWVNTDGLATDLDSFFSGEFIGARVYAQLDGEGRLWIEGRSGTPYSLKPYKSKRDGKENLAVAAMWPMPFVPEVTAEPLLVLAEGIVRTTLGWESPRGPSWAPYFLHARKTQNRTTTKSPRESFVDRLRITLDAERELTARQIYAFRVIAPVSIHHGRQVVEVELDPSIPDPEFGGIERPSVESWFRVQFAAGRLDVELSDAASPVAPMHPNRQWRIREFREGNRLLLERTAGGLEPTRTGWLRPWSLVYLLPLLHRKQRTVELAEVDDYLLQTLVEPESVTIFPGTKGAADLADDVLGTRPLYLIQGPPGTGKTYWAARVIEKMLREDETSRILVSAQAHKPLDHLMDETRNTIQSLKLDPPPILLRLARKEDLQMEEHEETEEDLHSATRTILERAAKWFPKIASWEEIGKEWRMLVSEQLEAPSPAWEDIVRGSANVVFITSNSGALKELEKSPPFDLVIIEEAAKAYATELLPPMRLGRRWLLIGDQQQLPPFQHREMVAAAKRRLESDDSYNMMDDEQKARLSQLLEDELRFFGALFARVQAASYPYKPRTLDPPAIRLKDQWRMPPLLSELVSTVFYGEPFRVRTPDRPLPFRTPEFLSSKSLVWLDVPHCASTHRRGEEQSAPEGGYINRYEAKVIDHLLGHLGPGLSTGGVSLVVLSPYTAQVNLLRRYLRREYPNLPHFHPSDDVQTVDSFQGRQADLVIVSMVRNNDAEKPLQALGFLLDDERMDVLLSRASHQLVVVGCLPLFETFSTSPETAKIREVGKFVRGRGVIADSRGLLGEESR